MHGRLTPGLRRGLGAAAVLLLGLTIGAIVLLFAVKADKHAANDRAKEAATHLGEHLRTALEALTAPADAVGAQIVAQRGAPNPDELGSFALQLLNQSRAEGHALRQLDIAPGNVIAAVWPRKGNEAAIGLNIEAIPAQWDRIKDRIAARESTLTGPTDLVQGGRAFVYQTPVFLEDGTYWGLSSALLDYSTVGDLAKAAAPKGSVSIRALSPSGDAVDIFGSPQAPGHHVAIEQFAVPGATWQVAVAPMPDSTRIAGIVGAVSVVLSTVMAALTYRMIGLSQRANSSRQLIEVLARQAPGMLFQYRTAPDGGTAFDYVSPRMIALMGWDENRLATDASEVWTSVDERDLSKTQMAVNESLQKLTPLATRMRMRTRDGQLRWFQIRASPDAQPGGDIVLHGYLADVTEEMDLEERLAVHASMFRVTSSGALILSGEGIITDANPAFAELTGYQPADVMGQNLRFLAADVVQNATDEAIWRGAESPDAGAWRGPFTMRLKDGRVVEFAATALRVRDADDTFSHLVFLFSPLSELRDDIVTRLPGRPFFLAQTDIEIERRTGSQSALMLAVVGLDRFADVNDSLGHARGDAVLRTLAARLEAGVPDQLALARVGGDEFAILLPATTDSEGMTRRLSSIVLSAIVAEPFTADGQTVQVGASIGTATWPHDASDAATLLEAARQALRSAKENGRGQCRHFTNEMREAATMRARILEALDHIHSSGDFSVAFQPIVDLASRRVVKAEALARLNHPLLGPISPVVFISIAEEYGRIGAVGDFVFAQAASLAARARIHDPAFSVAVNISPAELRGPASVHKQRLALLQPLGLPGSAVTLEITEQAALEESAATLDALKLYRDQGAEIAIDDFGTGYSSLSYLSRLSTNYLKIDRSFVQQLARDTEIASLVSAIADMARSLNLKTVAEGIETEEQLQLVREARCDFGQGYLFAKPMSDEDLLDLLREQPFA